MGREGGGRGRGGIDRGGECSGVGEGGLPYVFDVRVLDLSIIEDHSDQLDFGVGNVTISFPMSMMNDDMSLMICQCIIILFLLLL